LARRFAALTRSALEFSELADQDSVLAKVAGRMEEARELYEQALAISREVGDRRFEGAVLGSLAAHELLLTGNVTRAREPAAQGEARLSDLGDKLELGKLLCTAGHIALAGGQGARLERVRAIALELSVGRDSELGRDIAKLERAQAAFEAGRPLLRGYLPEDLTDGQRQWIASHAPEAAPGKEGP